MSELERLHYVDTTLLSLSKELHLLKYLFPSNASEERARFIEHNGDYNPQFTYTLPAKSVLETTRTHLLTLQKDYFFGQTYSLGIAHLLEEKLQESIWKAELLLAYHDQDFDRIDHFMKMLYGEFDENILAHARTLMDEYRAPAPTTWGEILEGDAIAKAITGYIDQHHLRDIEIQEDPTCPSKFSIRFSPQGARLTYNPKIKVRALDLEADLIHELGVHYARYLAGKSSGRHVLTYGTAGYITTEEGIALYQVIQYKKSHFPQFEKMGIYQKYIFLHDMTAKSGKDITAYLRAHKIAQRPEAIFDLLLRSKLGVQDCSIRYLGTTFLHMKVYADGYHKVLSWLDQGHSLDELFQGKIKIEDIPFLGG